MYQAVLTLHSWMRWLILVAGIILVVRGWIGWQKARPWTDLEERLARLFPILVDVQLLLGLLLFFVLSPNTSGILSRGMAALSNDHARFWAMEHVVPMLAAFVLVHVGQVFIRRSENTTAKHRWAAIVFGLAMLIILLSIPWPFTPNGRPLFRLG